MWVGGGGVGGWVGDMHLLPLHHRCHGFQPLQQLQQLLPARPAPRWLSLSCTCRCCLLCADELRLGDFGLAIKQDKELPFLRAGTLDYMAPEVLENSLVEELDESPGHTRRQLKQLGLHCYNEKASLDGCCGCHEGAPHRTAPLLRSAAAPSPTHAPSLCWRRWMCGR